MTVLLPDSKGHIVLFAYEAWGHTRPLCSLAARIVRLRGVHVTFLTTQPFHERVTTELARNFEANEDALRGLIRVIALVHKGMTPAGIKILHASFAEAYSKLANQEAITCAQTNVEYGPLPRPDAAIIDFIALDPLKTIRKHTDVPTKVFAWYTGATSAIFRLFGPTDRGGPGDLRPKIIAGVTKTGRPPLEVADELALQVTGAVVQIPGLPAMYDYEFQPQKTDFNQGIGGRIAGGFDTLSSCDGVFSTTPECYEPKAIAALKDWFAETSRRVYVCGPLFPMGEQAVANEKRQSSNASEIVDFLDAVRESHGPQSLVYISFGTIFWSKEPEKIWAFLDVLIERRIPFLMSHASPYAVLPEEVVQKVVDYGLGLLCSWSPQQMILGHEVTGWFVTHGGHNSVMESISFGIPMICWPFSADQPVNALHLTHNLNVAYELVEVRTGHGLKPLHRSGKAPIGTVDAVHDEANEVLAKAFGQDGEEKRANILRLKDEINQAWEDGGPSRRDLEEFLDSLRLTSA